MQPNQKGTLISWNDNRGFGFIAPATGAKKIFLHISALKKHGRRPQEGDTIYYQLNFDRQNRPQATNAYIEGVHYQTQHSRASVKRGTSNHIGTRTSPNRKKAAPYKQNRNIFRFIMLIIVIVIAGIAGSMNGFKQKRPSETSTSTRSISSSSSSSRYQCSGKIHCSQMSSCEEAKFYLRNCPGVKIDGDNDGIPCEKQLCGH